MRPFRAVLLASIGSLCLGGAVAQQQAGGATTPSGPVTAPDVSVPQPAPAPAPRGTAPRPAGVSYDPATGWPILPDGSGGASSFPRPPRVPADDATAGVPAANAAAGNASARKPPSPSSPTRAPSPPAVREQTRQPLVSGTQLGSPLLDVFQATGSPGAWKQLGGVTVAWRLTTYGSQGDVIGARDVTHVADTAFAERDRLEHGDGRVLGRIGAQVFASRSGMPLPTAGEPGGPDDVNGHELMLFSMHLRLPWLFGDANAFAVVGREVEERSGEKLRKIVLERRAANGAEVLGPEQDPRPRDRFELLYEPSSGRPRELVHRFACSLETRRVLLEDWREVGGVQLPFRRVYVDEALRPTTVLQIERLEPQRVDERVFRAD